MYGDDNNYNGIQKIARMTIFFQNKNIIIVIIVKCTVYVYLAEIRFMLC